MAEGGQITMYMYTDETDCIASCDRVVTRLYSSLVTTRYMYMPPTNCTVAFLNGQALHVPGMSRAYMEIMHITFVVGSIWWYRLFFFPSTMP